jgi:hypothetical protein
MIDAKHLTQELNGKWFGHYGVAFCPAHENTNTPALSIKNAESGDLLTYCHAGCKFTDVQAALRSIGLMPHRNEPSAPMPRQQTPTYPGAPTSEQRATAANRAKYAAKLWQAAQPISDTHAARYLCSRSIDCPLPPTLRFQPDCKHPLGSRMPAMLARVDGAMSFALHRTYLERDSTGKTNLLPAKAMLGSCKGGAVHLSPITIHAEGGPLVVTEGIENGLSLLSGLLDQPATVWAALSTSGMASLNLPRQPGHLIIAADGDPAGKTAACKLSYRATDLGWRVSHLTPPDGTDWNTVLIHTAQVGEK